MEMRKFSIRFIIISLMLSLLLAAPLPAGAQTPQYGGVLKIILPSGIRALGAPSQVGRGSLYSVISTPALESLVRHDNQFRITPRLAESWDIAPDGKTITFHLRRGIKFQDGTDFNAAAMQYHMDTYTTMGVKPSYMRDISSYEVIDDFTLRLHLSNFNLNLLFNLVGGAGLAVSPKALQKKSTPDKEPYDHMVGTGAFSLVSYEQDVKAVFKKVDNYWQKGKPYLDGIEFRQIADPVTAVMALKSGDGHLLYNITPEQATELKAAGFNIVPENLNPVGYITPDGANQDSPFGDKRVREALEYAIDKEPLAKGIGMGYFSVLTQFAAPSDNHYSTRLKAREYNPEKAKQLLKEAGYPNGFNTSILAMTTANRDVLVALQAYLNEVGIKAKLEIQDLGLLMKTLHEGWNNGILVNPFPCNAGLPTKIEMFFSADLKVGRTVMASHYKPKGWQERLQAAVTQPDPDKRTDLTREVCEMMHEEAMAIPLWTAPQISAIDPKVHDIHWAEGHGYFYEPQDTWLSR